MAKGTGTKEKPWELKTPSGLSTFQAYKDETSDPPLLVVTVGSTTLQYQLRCLEDLRAMLKAHGDWMPLGSADEQKPAASGTVEAWARASTNPVGGWYGVKKGLPRPICELRPSGDGGDRLGRSRALAEEQ